MQKNLILQRGSAVASALVLAGLGFSGLASASSISDTGPDSNNTIKTTLSSDFNLKNSNWVDLMNHNSQVAVTGDAKVKHNTNAGDASTGDATNDNSSSFDVAASNGGSGGSGMDDPMGMMGASMGDNSISDTGPSSDNKITTTATSKVNVTNTNKVTVNNSNNQTAVTGDATVSGNTNGGSATTGNAGNTNSTDVNVTANNGAPSMSDMMGGMGMVGMGGSISDTGPDSNNSIITKLTSNVKVSNTNNVSVGNSNNQTAVSGDATVSGNTNAGDATTGSAGNWNSTNVTVNATNG